MFKSILVVCVGNICRSPMAEAILQHHLQNKGITVRSAGLGALVGKPMDPTALQVLQENGYDHPVHQARQLNRDMLHEYDLILAMEPKHLHDIFDMAPEARGKSFLFGKWQGDKAIPDPYRQQKPAFEHVYKLISEGVSRWSASL